MNQRIKIENYGQNKLLFKGQFGSRVVDLNPLPGESQEATEERIKCRSEQAAMAVADPGANPRADIDEIMGIKSEDRLPIEATATGVSFRAASPADIAAYKRHCAYGGN